VIRHGSGDAGKEVRISEASALYVRPVPHICHPLADVGNVARQASVSAPRRCRRPGKKTSFPAKDAGHLQRFSAILKRSQE
jgi:hypothetical protein